MTSQELVAISPGMNKSSLELLICSLSVDMTKMLDQQLSELRELALKIKERLGLKVNISQFSQVKNRKSQNGRSQISERELIKELLEKFFVLDDYIDKLR